MNHGKQGGQIYYGWVVLGAAFLVIMVGIGSMFTAGVFLVPLQSDGDVRMALRGERASGSLSHSTGDWPAPIPPAHQRDVAPLSKPRALSRRSLHTFPVQSVCLNIGEDRRRDQVRDLAILGKTRANLRC